MSGVRVFISFSHRDHSWKERLGKHLKIFEAMDALRVWSDGRILPGVTFRQEILQQIDTARVAVLLISADFLSSDFILEVELPRILERHQSGDLKVVPVLVQPCPWQDVPWLSQLQMRPYNATPLATRRRPAGEVELARIAREILELARKAEPVSGLVGRGAQDLHT